MHFLCFTLCLSLVQALAFAQSQTRYPIVKDKFKKTMDGQTYYLAKINQKKGVIARDGQTLAGLAKVGEVELDDFLKFNDLEINGAARAGVPYYFEEKAKYGQVHFHVLEPTETLWEVSQRYDLQMKYLLKYNRLKKPTDPEVKPWLVVLLKSKRPRKMAPEYRPKPDPATDSPSDFNPRNANPTPAEEVTSTEDSNPLADEFANAHADDPDFLNEESNDGTAHPAQPLAEEFYVVQEGDNLTSIARNFNVSAPQIRELNGLPYSQTTVPVGTKLRIKKASTSTPRINTNTRRGRSTPSPEDPNYEYYDGKKGESLLEIARQFNCTEEAVRDWNSLPHTMRRLPEDMQLKLRIHPQVKDRSILDIFPAPGITKDEKLYPVYDRVLVGQDLAAFVYSLKNDSITVEKVRDWNNIPYTQSKMAAGTRLIIGYTRRAPFKPVDYPPLSVQESMAEVSENPPAELPDGRKPIYYTVKKDDTFRNVSSEYGITPEEIRKWNNLDADQRDLGFMVGKKIIVGFEGEDETSEPVAGEDTAPAEEKKPIFHIVGNTDTARGILGTYSITKEQVWEWNEMPVGTNLNTLEPGLKLIVGYSGAGSSANTDPEATPTARKRETRKRMVYVKEGYKLQDIAGEFKVDAMKIRELNGISGTAQPTPKSYIAIKEHEVVFITDSTYSDTEQTFYVPSAEIATDTAAARLGVDVNHLYSLNGLGGEVMKLKPGIGYAILDKPDPTLVKEGAFPSLASGDTPPGDNSGLADNSTYPPQSNDGGSSTPSTPQGDYHYVSQGETLWGIARNYGISYSDLRAWNPSLNPDKIDVNDQIRVTPPADNGQANQSTPDPNANAQANGYHIIQLNESVYVLADQYGLKKTDLLAWNNITDEKHIRVGDTLWLKDRQAAPVGYHIAKANENVYNIVAKYKLDKAAFLRWNRLPGNTIDLEAGKQYIIDASKAPEVNAATTQYHTVQPGDSFHTIATKYNVTVRQLKAWNNRKSDLLYKGEQIIVAKPAE